MMYNFSDFFSKNLCGSEKSLLIRHYDCLGLWLHGRPALHPWSVPKNADIVPLACGFKSSKRDEQRLILVPSSAVFVDVQLLGPV